MKKINIGVMGCANIATRSVIPAILESGQFNLVGIASRTEEKAAPFAEQFHCESIIGYDSLVKRDDIEAVYMPLPTACIMNGSINALRPESMFMRRRPFP
jgi:NDP-hexose-3-ketoreductase